MDRSRDGLHRIVFWAAAFAVVTGACVPKMVLRKSSDPLLAAEQTLAAKVADCAGSCANAGRLARRLERFHFQMAKRADTVSGWKWFLRRHPRGLFAGEARRALADKRFVRAKSVGTWWMWQWFLLQHPASAHGTEAEIHLHRSLSSRLLKHPSVEALRAFLRRYPTAVQRKTVRAALSRLEFSHLSRTSPVWMLEAYLLEFSGSDHAAVVRGWLEGRWRSRVQVLGTWRAMDAYRRRYPASRHLLSLRMVVGRAVMDRAVAEFDPTALRRLAGRLSGGAMAGRAGIGRSRKRQDDAAGQVAVAGMAREALRVAEQIERDRALADRLRRLSRMVRPFDPRAGLVGLVTAATGGDAAASVAAIHTLSFKNAVTIPGVLLDLSVAGAMPSVAWLSLRRWYRRAPAALARLVTSDLEVRYRGDASLVAARKLILFLSVVHPENPRIRSLVKRLPRPGTLTLCAVAFAGIAQSRSPKGWPAGAGKRWLRRCRRSLQQTVKNLSGQIPTELARQNVPSAVSLLLRLDGLAGLLALVDATGSSRPSGTWTGFRARLAEARQRLAAKIGETAPTMDLTVPYSVSKRARRHAGARMVGWKMLLRDRSNLARILRGVLCRHRGWTPAACPSYPGIRKGRPQK